MPARTGDGDSGTRDPAAALAWLEAERPNLVALVLAMAADRPPAPELVVALAQTLYGFFYRRGHVHDWVLVNEAARRVARTSGNRPAEARACADLGLALNLQGRHEQSLSCLRDGLAICHEIADPHARHSCLLALGSVWLWRRRPDRAEPYLAEGLSTARANRDRYGEAMCLSNLGLVHEQLAHHERARAYHHDSLALFREVGCARGQGLSLHSLARLDELAGDHASGERRYAECVDLLRAAGDRTVLAHALGDLGRALRRVGKPELALSCVDEALPMCKLLGLRAGEATCHQELALLIHPVAPDEARRHWSAALAIFTDIGLAPLDEALAILGDPDDLLVGVAR